MLGLPLAAQPLDECKYRRFAIVERHVVEVVEHAGLVQLAQLGIDVAAAQYGHDSGVLRLDGLRDPERRVNRAGKRRGHEHHIGAMALDGGPCQVAQCQVDQIQLSRQGRG